MKGYVSIAQYNELKAKYAETQAAFAATEFRLQQLERMIYGAKSERFYGEAPPDEQLNLFDADTPEKQAEIPTQKVAQHERKVTKPKKKPARQALPEHLPRKENIIPPEGLTDEMVKIGEERSEQLVYVQAKLHVEVTVRPKYVLPPVVGEYGKTPVLIAPMPERFIPKCIAHNTLLASILVDKYVDHLPLYRTIERIFRLSQLRLPKSTVSGWVKQSAERLNLLYEKLVRSVLDTAYLQVDETRMEVLPNSPPPSDERKIKRKRNRKNKPIKRKTERGWLWVYHAPETKLTFCDYDPSRGANNPARHLKNYKGTVQSDGLEVYEIIAKAFTQIEHYQCLVHARRKFEAALNNDRKRAEHALSVFQQIYELEDRAKEADLSTEALYGVVTGYV